MPFQFAKPRIITSLDECYFYHTIGIPGHGTVNGEWDLRNGLGDYLGNYNFRHKKVLDVGAASGCVSFHLEHFGAEVISFDLSDEYDWDMVPHHGVDYAKLLSERREHIRRINNGYWLCHGAFNSKARVVHGVVYDIPVEIGPVDVAFYGSILLHLRDPFLALQNGARLANEAIIVSEIAPSGWFAGLRKRPKFCPSHKKPNSYSETWWKLPPKLISEYLAILGFEKQTLSWHKQLYAGRKKTLYTLVARRENGPD